MKKTGHSPSARPGFARWIVAGLLLLAGCASEQRPAEPEQARVASSELDYSHIRLEFVALALDSAAQGTIAPGAGTSDGVSMMLQAPVGCMQAGMLYGFCLAMAPLFPALAARNAQDPEIAQREIQALAEHMHAQDLPGRLQRQLEQSARDAELPLLAAGQDEPRTLTLRATVGPLGLTHEGYKSGRIRVALPYRFELLDRDSRALRVMKGEYSAAFVTSEWHGENGLDERIGRWSRRLPRDALANLVLEWQPRIVLEPVTPHMASKRNIIGILQDRWSFADSTTPLLEWQPLEDALDPGVMAEVSEVRYELTIGDESEPLYRAVDLSEPRHRVARTLASCAYYYWKPRARFRYHGMEFTTSLRTRQWSADVTLDYFYVLMTPAERCKEPQWQPLPEEAAPAAA